VQVFFLYASLVLIWGSTWIAITYQLGPVADEVSVSYRFAIASIALFLYALFAGKRIALPLRQYGMVIVQGLFLFSLNYIVVYSAAHFITSGLIAVCFSLIIVFNSFFERLFFGASVEPRFILATLLGIAGISLVFWPEVERLSGNDSALLGVLFCVLSVLAASLGNMAALFNLRRSLPVISLNAHAMAWGAAASALAAIGLGRPFDFSLESGYVISLAYLSIFGSAIAFGCMLALMRRIGAARTAYSSVLFPIVALTISTIFENYQWTKASVAGVILALIGNWLALTQKNKPV